MFQTERITSDRRKVFGRQRALLVISVRDIRPHLKLTLSVLTPIPTGVFLGYSLHAAEYYIIEFNALISRICTVKKIESGLNSQNQTFPQDLSKKVIIKYPYLNCCFLEGRIGSGSGSTSPGFATSRFKGCQVFVESRKF